MSKSAWINLFIRLLFGLVFLIYGINKLVNYAAVVDGISSGFVDSWLPMILVKPFAYILPVVEFLLGIWFLTGFKYRTALITTGFLMILLIFGKAVQGDPATVGRNMIYMIILLIGLWHTEDKKSVSLESQSQVS